jgi:N-carbamoylputrescine amidase
MPTIRKTPRRKSARASSVVPVAITQMACGPDPRANLARQLRLLEKAAKGGAKILCTQELFASQYFCQAEDHRFFALAEKIPGPGTEALAKLAKKHRAVVIGSLFERRAAGLYHNTAVVIDADGSLLGTYRKMHIPDDPLYYEKFYFTPGDTGFRAWKTAHATIGVLICWDQWFPEGARLTAMQGAEILFYPTAIGWHPGEKKKYGFAQHDAWETIQRSHAIANGCYVCAPNRIGHELVAGANGKPVNPDGIEFWGQSFVCGPDGQVIRRASAGREEIVAVDCDLARVESHRTHWPFLRDRRVDAYGDLVRRFSDKR